MLPEPKHRAVQELRHLLHQNPELSGQERATQALLREKVQALAPKRLISVGHTGLLATFVGKTPEGPKLLFRADTDALPIPESLSLDYGSQNPGVAHKCGHDGHTAALFGLAISLSEDPPERGSYHLLFQPAEETGAGALKVLEDSNFDLDDLDGVYAFHNIPGQALGTVLCRPGTFAAAVISVAIELLGSSSHAGEPEMGANPLPALQELLHLSQQWQQPDPQQPDFALLTPVHLRMGQKAYGLRPGDAELHLTLRTWQEERLDKLRKDLQAVIDQSATAHNLKHSATWLEHFPAVNNHPQAVAEIEKAAMRLGLNYSNLPSAFRWGEDFGHFTQRYPGAMFGLGSGLDVPPLHDHYYDFPDALLPTAVKLFRQLINQAQGK